MSELTIGLILPDVLGTYGDNGNALVLRGRARKRGIDTEVVTIKLGEPVPTNLDLYCVGGGEDTAQILAAKHLTEHRGLIEAANLGRHIQLPWETHHRRAHLHPSRNPRTHRHTHRL